jgi:hypothetical protein
VEKKIPNLHKKNIIGGFQDETIGRLEALGKEHAHFLQGLVKHCN